MVENPQSNAEQLRHEITNTFDTLLEGVTPDKFGKRQADFALDHHLVKDWQESPLDGKLGRIEDAKLFLSKDDDKRVVELYVKKRTSFQTRERIYELDISATQLRMRTPDINHLKVMKAGENDLLWFNTFLERIQQGKNKT